MSIRRRSWTTSGGEAREAWIVDYAALARAAARRAGRLHVPRRPRDRTAVADARRPGAICLAFKSSREVSLSVGKRSAPRPFA
jgi:hypothetical protein